MLKRTMSLLLAMLMCASLIVAVLASDAEPAPEPQPEEKAPVPVEELVEETVPTGDFYVNGQPVYDAAPQLIEGEAYFHLRALFETVLPGCTISWDGGQALVSGVTAAGETVELAARPGDCYVAVNGRCLYLPAGVQLIGGKTMLPLSLLAELFNGSLQADAEGIWHLETGEGILPSGDAFYDPEALDLLSRLIYSESGNQSMLGMLAVGSVVLNRVDDPVFPSTLYDVIYQRNQFSVVANGTINKTPSEDAVIAAKLCLEGARVTEALFFHVSGLNCWAAQNRTYIATIGCHDFYA